MRRSGDHVAKCLDCGCYFVSDNRAKVTWLSADVSRQFSSVQKVVSGSVRLSDIGPISGSDPPLV